MLVVPLAVAVPGWPLGLGVEFIEVCVFDLVEVPPAVVFVLSLTADIDWVLAWLASMISF